MDNAKTKLLKLQSEQRMLKFNIANRQPDYIGIALGIAATPCIIIGVVYDNPTFMFCGITLIVLFVLALFNRQEKRGVIINRIAQLEQEILKLKIEGLEN